MCVFAKNLFTLSELLFNLRVVVVLVGVEQIAASVLDVVKT